MGLDKAVLDCSIGCLKTSRGVECRQCRSGNRIYRYAEWNAWSSRGSYDNSVRYCACGWRRQTAVRIVYKWYFRSCIKCCLDGVLKGNEERCAANGGLMACNFQLLTCACACLRNKITSLKLIDRKDSRKVRNENLVRSCGCRGCGRNGHCETECSRNLRWAGNYFARDEGYTAVCDDDKLSTVWSCKLLTDIGAEVWVIESSARPWLCSVCRRGGIRLTSWNWSCSTCVVIAVPKGFKIPTDGCWVIFDKLVIYYVVFSNSWK